MMWSETVGLRTRPASDQKKVGLGLGLAGLVLCCETRSCHARRHNYYYYRVQEPYVVSQSTAASSASCKRSRPPSN